MAPENPQRTAGLPSQETVPHDPTDGSVPTSGVPQGRDHRRLEVSGGRNETTMDQRNGLHLEATLPADMMPRRRKIPVAVDAVALITTECITVTSAMRKHARWAHSSVSAILGGTPSTSKSDETITPARENEEPEVSLGLSSMGMKSASNDFLLGSRWGLRGKKGKSLQDDPLIAAFARLRNDLRWCTGKFGHNTNLHHD